MANLYAQRIRQELLRAIMQCSFHPISHLADTANGDAKPRFIIRTGRQTGADRQTDGHVFTDTSMQTGDLGLACIKILTPDCHIGGCGPIAKQFHLQYLLRMQLQSRGSGCLLSTAIAGVGDTGGRQADPNLVSLH